MKEGRAAAQQRKCDLAASYNAQVLKTEHAKSIQPHITSPFTENSVPLQDRPMAPGGLQARSFMIQGNTDYLIFLLCSNKYSCTQSTLLKLATRLRDCEAKYMKMA